MMKYFEIDEHNKGDQGPSVLDTSFFDRLNLERFHYFHRSNKRIDIYKAEAGNQVYYLAKREDNIIAYVYIQQYDENVWQVKGSYVYNQQDRGKGIGSELYMQIVLFDKKKLISDDQLSDSAEKLWTTSLPKSGKNIKIYDVKEKNTYTFKDVGRQTSDGAVILDPKYDNERDRNINASKFTYENPRFYYLLEWVSSIGFESNTYRRNRLIKPKFFNENVSPPLLNEWLEEEKFYNWSYKIIGNSWY